MKNEKLETVDYDEETLKDIKRKISENILSGQDDWTSSALQYCVALIEQLKEENESVWFMLDEMKASTWNEEHTAELKKAVDFQIASLRLMQMRKGEA